MTATAGSEVWIPAPLLQEPVTGMLAQLPVISGPEGDRWLAGLKTIPEEFGPPEFSELCSTNAFAHIANRLGARIAQPFMLNLRDRCSNWGWNEADYEERATRGLAVKRHWGVEREFEKAALIPGNFHLAATYADPATATLASGAAVSPADALALLDESIGNSPAVIGRGLIFCTPFVGAQWKHTGMLTYENVDDDAGVGRRATILSPAGNLVIICGGMEGRGPDGSVPSAHSAQWAYATDPMVIVQSSPETFPRTLSEAEDFTTGDVVYRQQQFIAVVWPAMHHAAVQVATATPTDVGGDSVVSAVDAKVLAETIVRQTGAVTRSILVGARSRSVTVIAAASAASPTYNGVALPVGTNIVVGVDHPGDTLPAASLVTVAGDDVLFIETR